MGNGQYKNQRHKSHPNIASINRKASTSKFELHLFFNKMSKLCFYTAKVSSIIKIDVGVINCVVFDFFLLFACICYDRYDVQFA